MNNLYSVELSSSDSIPALEWLEDKGINLDSASAIRLVNEDNTSTIYYHQEDKFIKIDRFCGSEEIVYSITYTEALNYLNKFTKILLRT